MWWFSHLVFKLSTIFLLLGVSKFLFSCYTKVETTKKEVAYEIKKMLNQLSLGAEETSPISSVPFSFGK